MKRKIVDLAQSLPTIIPISLASFSAPAMLLLVVGKFYTWPVLLLGSVAAAISIYVTYRSIFSVPRPGSRKEQLAIDIVVIVGIVIWALCNLPFTAQKIYTDRDPATYGVTGVWLIRHTDLHIPRLAEFAHLPSIAVGDGGGFGPSLRQPNEVFSQGAHLLPALLGLGGRIVGQDNMFRLNVLIGAVALLAVYGFARLIMKPRWALMVAGTLAVSLPFFYFSRNTYTEPITAAFIFSSLTLLWYAQKTKHRILWLLAGVALGAGLLARIDAYLPIAAVEAFLIYRLITAPRGDRAQRGYQTAMVMLPVVLLGVVSWFDLWLYSSGYFASLQGQYRHEIELLILLAMFGSVLVILAWKTHLIHKVFELTERWRANVVRGAVVLFFILLALNPLRYITVTSGHDINFMPPLDHAYAMQNYEVLALYWLIWYLPVVTFMAISALAWLWPRLVSGKNLHLLAFMLVLSIESALYLVKPNISTDQIWATRRFLPIILPGFTILCFLFLEALFDKARATVRGQNIDLRLVSTALATLAVITPLFVSYPFFPARSFVPQVAQMELVCKSLPANAVVVWAGGSRNILVAPTQAFCGVPSFGLRAVAEQDIPAALKQLAETAHKVGKVVIIGDDGDSLGKYSAQLISVSTVTYSDVQQTYKVFPRTTTPYTETIKLGKLTSTGQLVGIN